jgi:hypothetical protein
MRVRNNAIIVFAVVFLYFSLTTEPFCALILP